MALNTGDMKINQVDRVLAGPELILSRPVTWMGGVRVRCVGGKVDEWVDREMDA